MENQIRKTKRMLNHVYCSTTGRLKLLCKHTVKLKNHEATYQPGLFICLIPLVGNALYIVSGWISGVQVIIVYYHIPCPCIDLRSYSTWK